MSKYLINKNYYIRDDLLSVLMYFDYFSQGLTLPILLRSRLTKKIFHKLLRLVIITIYFTKLYKFFYKSLELRDTSLVFINSRGERSNTIRLIEKKGKLTIVKKVPGQKDYLREKKFYKMYCNNPSRIKLPKHTFLPHNTIEIEFIKQNTLQRLITDGTVNFSQALEHFNALKGELAKLYTKNHALVHGDMWLTNILITENEYFLIDYSESHKNKTTYDAYVLLFSIFSSFQLIRNEAKSITNKYFRRSTIAKMLDTTTRNIRQLEIQFTTYRENRFLDVLYS